MTLGTLKILIFDFLCITGPTLPYGLKSSAMAESPDGRRVLLFSGERKRNDYDNDRILELHAAANSWKILDITLEKGRIFHVVIPLQ